MVFEAQPGDRWPPTGVESAMCWWERQFHKETVQTADQASPPNISGLKQQEIYGNTFFDVILRGDSLLIILPSLSLHRLFGTANLKAVLKLADCKILQFSVCFSPQMYSVHRHIL